ncbi:hypothetical protein Dimus_008321 [Dionaea muscipula]
MDLTYMDHLMARRLVDLPRVMMRHMSYVISVKDHELPYGDWLTMVFEEFGVQLVDKKGEERSDMTILRRLSSPCAVEGESGSYEQFYDAQVDVEELVTETQFARSGCSKLRFDEEATTSRVDPSCPTGRIPEAVMNKLQAEFERARANRFQDDLEKAQAKNAGLLA